MGNILEPSKSSYFLSEVTGGFTHLTKCKFHTGSAKDILLLQGRVAKIDLFHSCFVDPSQVKQLFKGTPIEGCELIITQQFVQKPAIKINIMEVLAALITYAEETLEDKVKLAIDVFDFDENHVITYDEMLILCKSFINAIGIMTNSALYSRSTLEALGDQAFIMADSTPDGQVTYSEFLDFITSNEILSDLLKTNQPIRRTQRAKRKSIIEQLGFEVLSSNYEGRRPTAKHKTEIKKSAYKKNEEKDETLIEISEIFKQRANNRGRILVRELYELIRNNQKLGPISEQILADFKFRLSSEVNFEEVKLCFRRKDAKIGNLATGRHASMRVESGTERVVQNLNALKEMFDRFDLNGDGSISLVELKKGLKDQFSVRSIEEMFKEYDFDGSGGLDFNEFVRMYSPDAANLPGYN